MDVRRQAPISVMVLHPRGLASHLMHRRNSQPTHSASTANPGCSDVVPPTNPGHDISSPAARASCPAPSDKETMPPLPSFTWHSKLEEAENLVVALGMKVCASESPVVRRLHPAHFFSLDKIHDFSACLQEKKAELLMVNAALSPVQQRNLEKHLRVKVIDRTGLILEIFARRARTKEGRLQVELARLHYQRSRLVRTWTHLERQRGGRGFLAGPGEAQIETDRRLLATRIEHLEKALEDVRRTRALHRRERARVPFPLVALVGYTNAGKSTLFNRLTKARVFARDMPFATLDPTMRLVRTPENRRCILSDTVGFISDLPTELIAAFRATLEEVAEADLILHVRDVTQGDWEHHRRDVEDILQTIKSTSQKEHTLIEVWNKIDCLEEGHAKALHERAHSLGAFPLSAQTGQGIDNLLGAIDHVFARDEIPCQLDLPAPQGRVRAWAYKHGSRVRETTNTRMWTLSFHLNTINLGRFKALFPKLPLKEYPLT